MISSDPQYTDPALAVIKRYDPETYAMIVADDSWHVTVTDDVTPGTDATTRVSKYASERDTKISPAAIRGSATQIIDVPVTDYLASIIVHEYEHHVEGLPWEHNAYVASVNFDVKLPGSDDAILRSDYHRLRTEN